MEKQDTNCPVKLTNSQPRATKSTRIRILVVDDDAAVRYATRQWLEMCTRFEVVAEATDSVEAVCAVGEYLPDIVLMDIGMPSMNGLEATARLTQRFPQRACNHSYGFNGCERCSESFQSGSRCVSGKGELCAPSPGHR